jgi:hypothetical protein
MVSFQFFEGPRLENIDRFYGSLEYFTNIWDILLAFGILFVHLVHFSGFGIMHQEKSGTPVVGRIWLHG